MSEAKKKATAKAGGTAAAPTPAEAAEPAADAPGETAEPESAEPAAAEPEAAEPAAAQPEAAEPEAAEPEASEPEATKPEATEPEAAEPEAGEPEAGEPEETAAAPDPVAALEAEMASLKDQLLRALAETENQRRRFERDRAEVVKYAFADFARELLSPVDNLRRALESLPADADMKDQVLKTLLAGVELTERELLQAFEKHGMRKIEPLDTPFDYNLHQAMFELENTGKPPGTVVEVLQPGYMLHDRLLRPAMVGLAKAKRDDPEPEEPEPEEPEPEPEDPTD